MKPELFWCNAVSYTGESISRFGKDRILERPDAARCITRGAAPRVEIAASSERFVRMGIPEPGDGPAVSSGTDPEEEQIQKRFLKPAGEKAELGFSLGWHTFRHTYRAWLDDSGAPMTVQHQLMRHASIQTTMNIYGTAMPDTKREANRRVVQMVLGEVKRPTFAERS